MYFYRFTIALICLLCTPLQAHDFWLQAEPFRSTGDRPIDISVRVGENLAGNSLSNRLTRYLDFSFIHQGSRRDVPGELGRDPAGYLPPPLGGLLAVGYQAVPRQIDIGRDAFRRYLREEGLSWLADHERVRQNREIEEIYIRYAKSLVDTGPSPASQSAEFDFGYRLELHSLQNPYALSRGDRLRLRLEFDDAPMPGAQLTAFCAGAPAQRQTPRSDDRGEVEILLDCAGVWLVKTIIMFETTDEDTDFVSYWTSLSFEIGE